MQVIANKKTLAIMSGTVLLIVFALTFFYFNNEKKKEAGPPNSKKAPLSFSDELNKFGIYFKTALLSPPTEDPAQALGESLKKWGEIADYYRYNQPPEFGRTANWLEKINYIYELLIKADTAAKEDKPLLSHSYLKQVGENVEEIKTENGQQTITSDFFAFYNLVESVTESKTKEIASGKLMELKLLFAQLKQINPGGDYKIQLGLLENIISRLDLLEGNDWQKARSELKPAFEKIFIQFG